MICIDTHLHFYDFYDARRFLERLVSNLESASPGADKAGIILDRAGGKSFDLLKEKALALSDFEAEDAGGHFRCRVGKQTCTLYKGIQVVCEERFEILGLFCAEEMEDGVPAVDALKRIKDAGGIPVLAWAPGKWMFRRRRLIEQFLKENDAGALFLGDTSLRPSFWGEPRLMQKFRMDGGKVLCGSDPLPFAGEERVAGCYASKLSADKGADVCDTMKRCLESDQVGLGCVGVRSGCVSFFLRMAKNL